jgi:hypothetical protein
MAKKPAVETPAHQSQATVAAIPAETPPIGSAAFAELSTEVRTQIIADDKYKGPHRFVCSHRDCPSIQISAASQEEAQARYQILMGIKSSENPFSVEPV